MGILNWGLEKFIKYISENRPTHIEVTTDLHEGGDAYYVCEYFGVFTGHYDDRKPVIAKKKYGGTTSDLEDMDDALDADIQRLQDMKLNVFQINKFKDGERKEHT